MASELKPCLLCEGEAKLLRRSGTAGRACPSKWYRERVECKVCGLTTREYKKPGAAAHSWNTRPAPAATVTGLVTVAWNCTYPSYGHFTLKEHEAKQAIEEGATVEELCVRSQAEELLADLHAAIAVKDHGLKLLQADNAAQAARIKELDAAWLSAEKQCQSQGEKLAAAEKALSVFLSEYDELYLFCDEPETMVSAVEAARAVLGGKPS